MITWLAIGALAILEVALVRVYYRVRKKRLIAERRRIERPNSHYASIHVQRRNDRERWSGIDLDALHPLNREEVERLLDIVEAGGIALLSEKDRIFLDHLAEVRGAQGGARRPTDDGAKKKPQRIGDVPAVDGA